MCATLGKLTIVLYATLPDATVKAADWLHGHGQTVEGVTASGVCVLADGVGVWLPAKRSALRDFMRY